MDTLLLRKNHYGNYIPFISLNKNDYLIYIGPHVFVSLIGIVALTLIGITIGMTF